MVGVYSCVELFYLVLVFFFCMIFIFYVMFNVGDYWRVDGLVFVVRVFGDKFLKEYMIVRLDLVDFVVDLFCEFLIFGSNGLWMVFIN